MISIVTLFVCVTVLAIYCTARYYTNPMNGTVQSWRLLDLSAIAGIVALLVFACPYAIVCDWLIKRVLWKPIFKLGVRHRVRSIVSEIMRSS